jgi:hypothetical protein
MPSDDHLSALARLVECVQSCRAPEEFRRQVIAEARRLVGCDCAVYGAGPHWRTAEPLYSGGRPRMVERLIQGANRYLPELDRWCAARRRGRPFTDGELYKVIERERMAVYRELLAPLGIHSILSCPFVFRGEIVAQSLLLREQREPPFASRDAARISLLAPAVAIAEAAMRTLFASRPAT